MSKEFKLPGGWLIITTDQDSTWICSPDGGGVWKITVQPETSTGFSLEDFVNAMNKGDRV